MTGSNDAWLKRHGAYGVLMSQDVEDLKAGTRRVFDLMRDGEWHSPEAIEMAAGENGVPARGGARRMRDLRAIPGVTVERRSIGGRKFRYRMTVTEYGQGRLFRL